MITQSFQKILLLLHSNEHKFTLVRDGAFSLFIRVVYVLLSFFISVLLARILGTEGYGVYAYAVALISLVTIPLEFGLPNLIVRETARGLAKQEWGHIFGVWLWTSRITLGLSFALIIGAGIIIIVNREKLSSGDLILLVYGIILVLLIAFGNLRGAALRGLNFVVSGQAPEQILAPGGYVFLILCATLISSANHFTPTLALELQAIAYAMAFVIGVWFLWRKAPAEIYHSQPVFDGRSWLSSTLPLAFTSGMSLIISRSGVVLLKILSNSSNAGVYRAADQMAFLISIVLQAMNMVIAQQIARFYVLGESNRLQKLATMSARISFLLTLPAVVVFLFFGKPLLAFLFGAEFSAGYETLAILSIGQLINASAGSVGFLLNMTGHEKDTARVFFVAAVGNILLSLLLIPRLGILGAAIASTVTMFLWNSTLLFFVYKRLGIDSSIAGLRFGDKK